MASRLPAMGFTRATMLNGERQNLIRSRGLLVNNRSYWVYIMTNRSGTLYIGLTNNLARRVYEHRHNLLSGFTSRYRIDLLVHAESFSEIRDAIAREKQLKIWSRARKLALIRENYPDGRDLADEWFGSSGAE